MSFLGDAVGGFLAQDGSTPGATAQAQVFNNFVGIGKTPDYHLHVYNGSGDTYVEIETGATGNNYSGFYLVSEDTQYGFYCGGASSTWASALSIYDDLAGASRIFVTSTGLVGINNDDPATRLDVDGAITFRELSADPTDPAEGCAVIWMSDGTGTGDDGDVIMKITAGGVTKTAVIADHSAL